MHADLMKSTETEKSKPCRSRRKGRKKKPFFMVEEKNPWPAKQKPLFDSIEEENNIILRPDHNISRKYIDKEALKVLYRLKDAGFTAYLVGGSVRDMLLRKRPKDFDIGTNARPEQIRKIFRHSRIIGKRFRLVHVYFRGGKIIEVSTFRKQTDYDDREAAREELSNDDLFGTPREDASRRDLTINGLFYNIANFSIIDYVGGMSDLQNGIVRAIGDPERRFLRDPVRMMRAVRHAARTDFVIEPLTWKAITENADKIRLCAIPRVRDEWLKDLSSGKSARWAELMLESGLFTAVFSGFAPVLNGPNGKAAEQMLIKMLEQLDILISHNKNVSEALQLSLLVYPVLHYSSEWHGLEGRKIRWPTYEVRCMLQDIFEPYDFRNVVTDQTAQIVATQWPLNVCVKNDNWPKRVWSKQIFPEAVTLYNIVRRVLGEPEIGNTPHTGKGTNRSPSGRRKKRGWKKRRSKAACNRNNNPEKR